MEPDQPAIDPEASSPTPSDIEALSAVTSRAFEANFSQDTAKDIQALTRALTTAIGQSRQTTSEEPAPPAVDLAAIQAYTNAVSQTPTEKAPGKRSAEEVFEQNQAAHALQLIALSLNSPSTSTNDAADVNSESGKKSLSQELAQVETEKTPSAESLISISNAIKFPTLTQDAPKQETDSTAFAQAVLRATLQESAKNQDPNPTLDSDALTKSTLGDSSSRDKERVTSTGSGAGTLGFTFEVDKATGRTQIKWAPDPREETNASQDSTTIQQALQSLMVTSGLSEFAELSVPTVGLPPLGAFPAQGSQFGTAQEPPTPRKKQRTTSSGLQSSSTLVEGAASFPCTSLGCGKVFARLYNLKSHSKTHTSERPFVCGHCQQAFARNHDLKRHSKIHGGDKPFLCHGCQKSFSRLDALGRHRSNAKNRAGCQASDGNEPPQAATL